MSSSLKCHFNVFYNILVHVSLHCDQVLVPVVSTRPVISELNFVTNYFIYMFGKFFTILHILILSPFVYSQTNYLSVTEPTKLLVQLYLYILYFRFLFLYSLLLYNPLFFHSISRYVSCPCNCNPLINPRELLTEFYVLLILTKIRYRLNVSNC